MLKFLARRRSNIIDTIGLVLLTQAWKSGNFWLCWSIAITTVFLSCIVEIMAARR